MNPTTFQMSLTRYGYEIDISEPTIGEYDTFTRGLGNLDNLYDFWLKHIKGWNCKDANGQLIPITKEGLMQLPATVLRSMANALNDYISGAYSDPKGKTA